MRFDLVPVTLTIMTAVYMKAKTKMVGMVDEIIVMKVSSR